MKIEQAMGYSGCSHLNAPDRDALEDARALAAVGHNAKITWRTLAQNEADGA